MSDVQVTEYRPGSHFTAETIDGYSVRVERKDHGKADLVLTDPLGETPDVRMPLMGDDFDVVRSLLDHAEQDAKAA